MINTLFSRFCVCMSPYYVHSAHFCNLKAAIYLYIAYINILYVCMCVSRILNIKVHTFTDIIKRTDPRYTQLFYLLSIITDTQYFRYFCMLYAFLHFLIHSAIYSYLKFRKKCNTLDSVFPFSERILVFTVAWRMATKTQGLLTKDTSVEAVNVTLTRPAILY